MKGYFVDPVKLIKKKTERFLNNLTTNERNETEKISLKFTADGTNLSRRVKTANYCFSIVNEKMKAATVKGCYRIGVFPIDKESYETIQMWLPSLWEKCTSFKEFYYNKENKKLYLKEELSMEELTASSLSDLYQVIKVLHSFSADYKMDLIVLGMLSANSNWPCIYCKQHKDTLHLLGIYIISDYTN